MTQTMEQKRAQHAWHCAIEAKEKLELQTRDGQDRYNDYVNAAKGMPALIMNSGLMQVLAYNQGKKEKRYELLSEHLRDWLHQTLGTPRSFTELMDHLYEAEPARFQLITREAFDWLRWMRQIAPALKDKED